MQNIVLNEAKEKMTKSEESLTRELGQIRAGRANPNILNYEVTIQNRYAQWQQELQSEEESLKAREHELNNKKR